MCSIILYLLYDYFKVVTVEAIIQDNNMDLILDQIMDPIIIGDPTVEVWYLFCRFFNIDYLVYLMGNVP